MNKLEVQKRVSLNGNPISLDDFTWCEKTKTFSTLRDNIVVDFRGIDGCTFNTGEDCTFKTGDNCTFNTGEDCTFKTGDNCTFNTGEDCTFDTGEDCTFTTGWGCTFKTGDNCTFDTGEDCTFKTGDNCTFTTGWGCTFKTGDNCTFDTGEDCTFDTGEDCTFKTGNNCTFDTGWGCTFKTGWGCTFTTGSGCTFKTGHNCVIVRRDKFEIIQPTAGETIQLCPYGISGYLVNGMYNGEPHIIADEILSKIVDKKGNVYRVINHGEESGSYLVTDGINYSHGATLEQAKESLIYKISSRDTTEYKDLTIDSVVTFENAVKMYRVITGACEEGVKRFVKGKEIKKEYTVNELIELTKNSYGSNNFAAFFNSKQLKKGN